LQFKTQISAEKALHLKVPSIFFTAQFAPMAIFIVPVVTVIARGRFVYRICTLPPERMSAQIIAFI
jgi:hypothetical protein